MVVTVAALSKELTSFNSWPTLLNRSAHVDPAYRYPDGTWKAKIPSMTVQERFSRGRYECARDWNSYERAVSKLWKSWCQYQKEAALGDLRMKIFAFKKELGYAGTAPTLSDLIGGENRL